MFRIRNARSTLLLCLTLAGISGLLLLADGPRVADAQPGVSTDADPFAGYDGLRWNKLRKFEGGPLPQLVDHRSTTVLHDHPMTLEKEWELFGHKFTFSLTRGRLKYEHLEPGKDRPKSKTISRLPVVLELGREDDVSYAIALRCDSKGEKLFASSVWGTTLRVGRDTVFVIDSDLDGKLGSAGDGFVVPGCKTVAPFGNEAWTENAALGLRYKKEEKEWETADLPMPKGDQDFAAAWRLYNWRRMQAGVPPVRFDDDDELRAAMAAHAKYAMRYGTEGRTEDDKLAGSSAEGAVAAGQCTTLNGARSAVDGIEQYFSMSYARSEILSGGLTKAAMVYEGTTLMINTRKYAKSPLRAAPIVWPPHGYGGLPRTYRRSGETPMPLPVPAEGNTLGYVIGAYIETLNKVTALAPKPEVVLEQLERGVPSALAGTLVAPGNRPDDDNVPKHNHGNVWLVPERQFPGATEFRARITVTFPAGSLVGGAQSGQIFTYEWSFATK